MQYKKMVPKWKKSWISALRSGKYKQIREQLKSRTGYCCLGVLSNLVRPDAWKYAGDSKEYYFESKVGWETHNLPLEVVKETGLSDIDHLVNMNDGNSDTKIKKHNFKEIADWIQKNL
jgi:hypothetical protein